MSMFKKAERKKAKLRLALCGPSGSGKTYSALQIAKGLGGKIAMIDTEHGSGELYAHLCEYDVARLEPPFHPDRYVELLRGAESGGYNVVIIDSLTHAWTGEGGLLDLVDKMKKGSSGSQMDPWKQATPIQNRFINSLLQSGCHVIATIRVKTAWDFVDDVNNAGRKIKKPVKIGLAPEQRQGLEYEFTAVLDISVDGHIATASKDRTGIFDGQYVTPSPETGKQLLDWLESGVDAEEMRRQEEQAAVDAALGAIHACATPEALTALWYEHNKAWETLAGFASISAAVAQKNRALQAPSATDAEAANG